MRISSIGQIPPGARLRNGTWARGLVGCWPYRTGYKRALDVSGNRLHMSEKNTTNTNASQGVGVQGRYYHNGGAVFDAPWCSDRDITPPLNVTYCMISRTSNASYPSASSEDVFMGGFAQSGSATMPPVGSAGNCSWAIYGHYGDFGAVKVRVLGKFSDTTALDQTLTLTGVAESDAPDWFATVFAFADAQQSVLAAKNLRTGKIDLATFAETKTLQSVAQPFTPFGWKNFAADFSWSEATPDVDVAFASLHARALSPSEIVAWLEAPHAIFDTPNTRPVVFAAGGAGHIYRVPQMNGGMNPMLDGMHG